MNFKKFISGVSALTIAASAFAGMAVTASAATNIDKSLFSQDFSNVTIDDLTINGNGGNFSPTVTVTAGGALNFSNSQARSVSSKYIFDDIVTASDIKNNIANLSFTVSMTGNNYYTTGNGRTASTCLYVLPDGVSQTVSGNKSEGEPSEYLYGLQITPAGASDAKTLVSTTVSLISASEDVVLAERGEGTTAGTYGDYGITLNNSSAPSTGTIRVASTIDFDADTATIAINNKTAFTVNLKTDKTGIEGFMFRDGNKTYGGATLDSIVITTPATVYDIAKTETNATATVDKTTAEAGETVTVTDLAANEGYVNPVISVKDADNNDVAVDENGQFTMPASDVTVTAAASLPGAVNSVKVKYQLSNGTEIQTDTLAITDCYSTADNTQSIVSAVEGDRVVIPFKAYILKDGTLYQTTANTSNPYYGDAVTLTSDTVLTKTVQEYSTAGTVVLFEDLDNTPGENAAIRASNMSAYNNTGYTSENNLPAGVYTFVIGALNKGRGSSVKVGDTTVAEIGDITNKNAWGTKTVSDVKISTAAKLSLQKGTSSIDCYDIIIAIKTADLYSISKASATNGSFTVSAETATAGTNVTITPTAAEGYEVDTVSVATADVTDNGNGTYSFTMPASDVTVSVAFKAVTPAGPSAAVTAVSYNQYKAEDTPANDEDLTAAKILVTVTGSITKLGLKYSADGVNWSAPQYAKAIDSVITGGSIVLGAIVPGLVELSTSSFDAVID